MIYVGNTDGVLEYDGRSWRLIATPNRSVVRSLAVDDSGRVFVGAAGEFGYLAPDARGRMQYVSLSDRLPEGGERFDQNVWGTHATGGTVYFQTYNHLLTWKDGTLRDRRFRDTLHTSFLLRGEVVVRQENRGLLRVDGDSLRLLPGGSYFADPSVYAVYPRNESGYVVATREHGLVISDGDSVRPASGPSAEYVRRNFAYHGVQIRDSLLAVATLRGGVLLLNEQLEIQNVLNEDAGLQDNRVYSIYEDREGGLWAALYRGVTRISLSDRMARFDERSGLRGAIQAIVRHRDRLYVGTMRGLYRSEGRGTGSSGSRARFEEIAELGGTQVWSLLSTEQGLLAGGANGVYVVRDGASRLVPADFVYELRRSRVDTGTVLVGTQAGLVTLTLDGGRWVKGQSPTGSGWTVRTLGEDSTGQVWLGGGRQGVARIGADVSGASREPPERFSAPPPPVLVSEMRGVPLMATESDTLYRPVPLQGSPDSVRFEPIGRLPAGLGPGRGGPDWIEAVDDSTLWAGGGQEVVKLHVPDGQWSEITPIFRLRFPDEEVLEVFEANETAWIGTNEGMVGYRRAAEPEPVPIFPVLVRRVYAGQDSLVFNGTHGAAGATPRLKQRTEDVLRLAASENRIRLEYTSPSDGGAAATQYQYRLAGFEEEWSRWTDETAVTYPYLPSGDYQFHVRARAMMGRIGPGTTFRFSIAPPWYGTWWAYLGYGLMGIGMVLGFIRLRTAASRRELEKEQVLNERLQEANEQLRRANQMKDEFLASMSHEIRTPLASIQGFAEILEEEVQDRNQEFIQLIQSSSMRLQETLTSLMELAQLRAGEIEAGTDSLDISEEVREQAEIFRPRAEKKGLHFSVCVPDSEVRVHTDEFCLERIVNNLVSNAIKFTDEGEVRVRLTEGDDQLTIEVQDTGVGIDEEFQPALFEAFRQESTGLDRTYDGVGLGLAITHQMVEILGGDISVESEKGSGTTFTVALPRNGVERVPAVKS